MKDYSLGKVVRAADGAGLENQCAVTPYQEFESLTFRGSADHARFRGRPGAIERSFRPALLVSAPESKPWYLHEFTAKDPDGNFLRVFYDFGSDKEKE